MDYKNTFTLEGIVKNAPSFKTYGTKEVVSFRLFQEYMKRDGSCGTKSYNISCWNKDIINTLRNRRDVFEAVVRGNIGNKSRNTEQGYTYDIILIATRLEIIKSGNDKLIEAKESSKSKDNIDSNLPF